MCQVMEVSRSGFYQYLKNIDKNRIDPEFEAMSAVRQIHNQTRGRYGSRRMSKELRSKGYDIGRYAARRLMIKAGVTVKHRKKFIKTTDSRHNYPIAGNLVNRQFQVDQPNRIWCSDLSYLWTMQGWLYLAVVIDLFSRKVVGWALSHSLEASLATEALKMAFWRRKPAKGFIHHSDRGSQYAGHQYQNLLKQYGMTCSMSRKGNCYDMPL
jgi:putative transposase